MIITEIPKRLAAILGLQVTGCIYCLLAIGAIAKGRRIGVPELHLPIDAYMPWVKNFGWLLFLLPCAWFFLHVREWWRNGADYGLLRNVVLTGLATFVIILWIAFVGTTMAMGRGYNHPSKGGVLT